MFAVVEWVDYSPKSVSVAPINWLLEIDGESWCYWPDRNVEKDAVRKKINPQPCWPRYQVICLTTAGLKFAFMV